MTDNNEILTCPACGKTMTKIFISSANCNIDVCLDGCGGIYFDNREFKKMDENAENIHELLDALNGRNFNKIDSTGDRICPICKHKMMKHFASAKHEIEIDDCYNCGGIFLDGEELMKIRAQFATEQERADHFNKMFAEAHSAIFNDTNRMDSRIDYSHLEKVKKRGQSLGRFFGL